MTKQEIIQIAFAYGSDMQDKEYCLSQAQAEAYAKSAKHFLQWCNDNGYRILHEEKIQRVWRECKGSDNIGKAFADLFTDKN